MMVALCIHKSYLFAGSKVEQRKILRTKIKTLPLSCEDETKDEHKMHFAKNLCIMESIE